MVGETRWRGKVLETPLFLRPATAPPSSQDEPHSEHNATLTAFAASRGWKTSPHGTILKVNAKTSECFPSSTPTKSKNHVMPGGCDMVRGH